MSAERGEYRSIHTVLLDGPDYQRLTPAARHVFLVLKLTAGSTGIIIYPGARYVLAERTGYHPDTVEEALTELERQGTWIEREANVLWVTRQLEFEPSLLVHTPNHHKYLESHLASLPRLAIVQRFRERYPEWVGRGIPTSAADVPSSAGTPPEPLRNPSGTPPEPLRNPSGTPPEPIPITTSTTTRTTTSTTTNRRKLPRERARGAAASASALPYLTRCVVAFNAGLADNPALGTNRREVCASEQAGKVSWEADGIPADLAEGVIRDVASRYQPTARNRQPTSLRYFDGAVRETWEREEIRTLAGTAAPRVSRRAGPPDPLDAFREAHALAVAERLAREAEATPPRPEDDAA